MTRTSPAGSLVALAVVCGWAASCTAPSDAPAGFAAGRRPIFHGEPDEAESHAAVVAISIGMGGMCSGTLIAPRVVLTAAHCVEGTPARAFRVGFGADVDSGGMRWVRVAEAKAHPGYTSRSLRNDIGLLRLSEAPPAGVEPIPVLPPSLQLGAGDTGTQLHFSGFGLTETGDTGTKLHVADTADLVCTNPTGCTWKGDRTPPNVICYDQRPGGPCSGDSGGPAFIVRDGQEYVAGVTSYGDEGCAYYGCSTKVDAFADFIDPFVKGTVGTACDFDADCREGRCIDGICCAPGCDEGCGTCGAAGALGTCVPRNEAGACDDGNGCTGGDTCRAGRCAGAPVTCPAPGPCHARGECNPLVGRCMYDLLPEDTPCSDGSLCTAGEACRAGACLPASKTECPAVDECHPGRCIPETGACEAPAAPDGTPCSKGRCDGGRCVSGCLGCSGAGAGSLPLWAAALVLALRRRVRRW